MNYYDLGDVVRCSAAFTNSAGVALDPTALTFTIKDPSGNETEYTYSEDAELVKQSTGNYYVDVSIDEVGLWWYRYAATGTGQSAGEERFRVIESEFD